MTEADRVVNDARKRLADIEERLSQWSLLFSIMALVADRGFRRNLGTGKSLSFVRPQGNAMNSPDWASTASAIFAGVSALFAAAAIYFPWRIQNSQEILNQAVLSLERAYAALSREGQQIQPPSPDRLNWLTAARHIERYRKLKAKLATETHRVICEEHEEFWRHKLYLCLDAPGQLSPAYYSDKPEPDQQAGIEPRSAIIVHEFAKWPEGREDPIDMVDVNAILARGEVLKGNYGLRQYLNGFKAYRTGA